MGKKHLARSVVVLSIVSIIVGATIASFALVKIQNQRFQMHNENIPHLNTASSIQNENVAVLSKDLAIDAYIGILIIPRLQLSVKIYQGTAEKQLTKGVGHYLKSVLPGANDNSIIAGHRDTYFSRLNTVKLGDLIAVKTQEVTLKYYVTKIRIVSKNDRSVIVPTKIATLTLSTCYPFIYFGNAPKRYVVIAQLRTPS